MVDRLAGRVRALLDPTVSAAGADLEAVETATAGRRRVIRIVVDTDDGISSDQVAALTRLVSEALDASDVMGEQPYVLEVTSPGVTRPLTAPKHWLRNRGRLVRVALRSHEEPVVGRIVASTDEAVTLDIEGRQRSIPLAEVRRAVIQVEMKER